MAVAQATTTETQRRAGFGWRVAGAFLRRREASILIVAGGLIAFFWIKRPDAFGTTLNWQNVTETVAPYAIVAAGEVMLLICGEIDLSVGNTFALTPALVWVVSGPDQHHLPIEVGVLVALAAAGLVGLVNGVVTTYFRLPSFIATLGMLFLLHGIILEITHSSQQFMPGGNTFRNIFGTQTTHPLYFNVEFFWALGLMLAVQFVLSWTRWGLHTISTGGNLIGAAEAGVNVRGIKVGNFILANTLAGFAGIIDSTRVTTIDPNGGGSDLMFLAVAGAVIGGTSLFGGVGTAVGSFVGVGVLIILQVGLNIIGQPPWEFYFITGIAIVAAMAANVQIARLRNLGRLQQL
jgi:simple sugar transport system permease protein